ncbi:MAG: hypothetical protein PHX61_07725 [Alphaproteobacteria bacterium]|nr:hypothetical protein [Alphaproteobacteria bacterium]
MRAEIHAAVESWGQKETAGRKVLPLIVAKRLEAYCQRLSDGETEKGRVSRADITALENIRETGWSDRTILRYVIEPYPLVNFQIKNANGSRWIRFFNRNEERITLWDESIKKGSKLLFLSESSRSKLKGKWFAISLHFFFIPPSFQQRPSFSSQGAGGQTSVFSSSHSSLTTTQSLSASFCWLSQSVG